MAEVRVPAIPNSPVPSVRGVEPSIMPCSRDVMTALMDMTRESQGARPITDNPYTVLLGQVEGNLARFLHGLKVCLGAASIADFFVVRRNSIASGDISMGANGVAAVKDFFLIASMAELPLAVKGVAERPPLNGFCNAFVRRDGGGMALIFRMSAIEIHVSFLMLRVWYHNIPWMSTSII